MAAVWTAVGEQAGGGAWYAIVVALPLAFLALLLFLVLLAASRQRRYRVAAGFGDDDRAAVRAALAAAERRTVGEILPVVVERSDPHPGAEWLAALVLVLLGSSALLAWMPWQHPVVVLALQLLFGGLGFGLARLLPDFKRRFVLERRADEVSREQAFQEFYANGLHRTTAATGVLIFVSLFERRVVILADEGIDAVVDASFWADTDDRVLDGIRRGSLRDGLIAGIARAGELLAARFPWTEGDRNEIPDRLIVRRE
ncbi:MAG TPA: TPM domain-containing protein [Candidatus Polarisedimenticolaceae bacterium]|nr:TPM domain-containing protein [Candidatus Polarisedimenticolaceae bacterium]